MSNATSAKSAIFVRAPEPDERPNGPSDLATHEVRPGASSNSHRPAGLDAQGLRASLVEAFEKQEPAPPTETKPATAPPGPAPRSRFLPRVLGGRLLKVVCGLALVVFFGWMPLQALLVASSVEAVVNSRVVTIRSPIDGVVTATPRDFAAWSVDKGAPLLRIVDDKAERTRLDDLRRALGNLEDERPSLVRRLDLAQSGLDSLTKQTQQFTEGRIRQLNARVAALNHDVAAASAKTEDAQGAFNRVNALLKSGSASIAESDRLRRDKTIAIEEEAAARQRLEEASVELAAANQGLFLGDSYNDRPGSAQRADEMRLRVGDLGAELQTHEAQIERLRVEIAEETERYEKRSNVAVALPVSGRVWEVLTAPGEHVSRGQDLMRLLDCASAVVTANVGESVYNQLQIGSPVTFRPSGGGEDYAGAVVNLTGAAGAPANFAILPSALAKEAYHVTVSVPKIAESGECSVGRTGRVIFEKASVGAPAASAEAGALGLRP
jgi:multidrug resistance efflux pump